MNNVAIRYRTYFLFIKLDTAVLEHIFLIYHVQICTVFAFISAIELPRIPAYFLKYMLIAEHSVKSPLTYHFKKIYGENQQEYLALIHYAVTKANQKNIQQIVQLKP